MSEQMFERFSDRARRVVILALEEARLLNHNYIGTEHILLGLIHEGEGVAARALQALGISLQAMRQQVECIAGRGEEQPSGHVPFTPRVKKVLELSLREALHFGHNYVGTGHLLLGVVREAEAPETEGPGLGVTTQVLAGLGTDLTQVRQQVIPLLKEPSDEGPPLPVPAAPGYTPGALESSGDILNALASITDRLAAIERRLGIPAPSGPGRHDQQIALVRSEKEAAIEAQDFEQAAVLRDREKALIAEKAADEQPAPPGTDVVPVIDEVALLQSQVKRLQGLLRLHGIDPRESPGPAE